MRLFGKKNLRPELERLKQGTPVVLVVELKDFNRTVKQPYYGHFYRINSNDDVELHYGPDDGTVAYLPAKDVLQVSPTTEEGLGKWGTKG